MYTIKPDLLLPISAAEENWFHIPKRRLKYSFVRRHTISTFFTTPSSICHNDSHSDEDDGDADDDDVVMSLLSPSSFGARNLLAISLLSLYLDIKLPLV